MIKGLRKQFILISIAAVAGVMLLLFALLNTFNYISTCKKLDNTLSMLVENQGEIPDFGKEEPEGGKPERDDDKRGRFNEETRFDTRFFKVDFEQDGSVVSSNLEKIASVSEAELDSYVNIALKQGEGSAFTGDYRYRVTKQSDGSYSALFLHADREISSLRTVFWVSLAATAACITLISFIIVLFSKKVFQPALEAHQKQKQFITDASHELKTPITVIATNMSVLEMEVGKQKWIDKTKAQTEKLKELVNALVSLARMDEEAPLHRENMDISRLCKESVESFQEYAAEQGHSLGADIAPEVHFCGDEYAVRQLVSILLDNAIKYASEGSPIRFSLQKQKHGVCISCENGCNSLEPEQLDKLFERFYRADTSHSSQKPGFGIGLSMAKSICQAHGGSIVAVSEKENSIRFVAKLKD